MFMSYDGLVFECLRIDDWSRYNVTTESGNYLFTHHEISGAAIINPDLMVPDKFTTLRSKKNDGSARLTRPFNRAVLIGGNGPVPARPRTDIDSSGDPVSVGSTQSAATSAALEAARVVSESGAIKSGQTNSASVAVAGGAAATAIMEHLARIEKVKAGALLGAVAGGAAAAAAAIAGKPNRPPGVPNQPQAPRRNLNRADAAISDFIVRQRLAVPRRKLFLWMHSNLGPDLPRLLLESPLGSARVDCGHGPEFKVTWHDVIGGNLTLVIGFKVVTDVNNWVKDGSAQTAMIGNSWSFAVSHDQDYFATHTIEGVASFRRDVLREAFAGQNPCDFRAEFMHPIPFGFKRAHATVKEMQDGVSVIYNIVDVEQPMHFSGALGVKDQSHQLVKPFATRIEVVEEQEYSQPLNI